MASKEINSQQRIELDLWDNISNPYPFNALKSAYPHHIFYRLDTKGHKFTAFLTHDFGFPTTSKNIFDVLIDKIWFPKDLHHRFIDLERKYNAVSTFFIPINRFRSALFASRFSKETSKDFEIGLQIGHKAALNPKALIKEKEFLERTTGRVVVSSRYRNLTYQGKKTIEQLQRVGFTYDSSFGYRNAIGFRGGISFPFRPYELGVIEIPFTIRDTVLTDIGLTPKETLNLVFKLIDASSTNNGTITINWHLDYTTLNEWSNLYEKVLEYLVKKDARFLTLRETTKALIK